MGDTIESENIMQWKTSAKIVAQVRKPLSSVAVCCTLCLGISLALAGEELWIFDTDAADWTIANGTREVQDGV